MDDFAVNPVKSNGIMSEYEHKFQPWITNSSTERTDNDGNRCAGPWPIAFLHALFLFLRHELHRADLSPLTWVPELACLRDNTIKMPPEPVGRLRSPQFMTVHETVP